MRQFIILLTGAVAIHLSQADSAMARQWACVFGMAGQPFFLLVTYRAKQWGMFALAVIYTGAWATGIWKYWIRSWL